MRQLHAALVHRGGRSLPRLTADFPALANYLEGPRFVYFKHHVPDAIFVHEDGARIVLIELARTDDLVEGYWPDRSAAKEAKYRPIREAIASITGATVA